MGAGDGRLVLLSDTVGFLQRLPHHLVASFHATLEEALSADMLLHVVDASHPDAPQQMAAVVQVLEELAAAAPTQALVLNKVDQVGDPIALHLLAQEFEGEVLLLSAKTGQGLERLEALVAAQLDARSEELLLRIPAADGRTLSQLRACGALLGEEWLEEGQQYQLEVRLDPTLRGRIAREALPGLEASRDGGRTFGPLVPRPPAPDWA